MKGVGKSPMTSCMSAGASERDLVTVVRQICDVDALLDRVAIA